VTHDDGGDLFEDAPCGLIATRPDGTILRVNRTFEAWIGFGRDALVGRRRFQELLTPGGRIYNETHIAPLLRMQDAVREVAVDLVHADGSRLPALLNCVLDRDEAGRPARIRTTVFDAADRRRYEQELLHQRRREQDIARLLQRSLLSGTLPEAPGLDLGVSYRPGVSGLEVGGDWYDGFWVDEGRTAALVVGDVVGRGIEAAAAMGQLRSAVRALAAGRTGPAALLDALDSFASRHEVGAMATLVYAELTFATRTLRFACAGHPPPLVVAPAGDGRFLWEGRSAPLTLGPALGGPERTAAELVLPPGATLLLYTDGLVEQRGTSIDAGMAELRDDVAAMVERPPADLADALLDQRAGSQADDDMCVVVARAG
jgi:PAS domain S-box-containing protein